MIPLSSSTKFNLPQKKFNNSSKNALLRNKQQEQKDKQEKASKRLLESHGKKKYPHVLSMYKDPPMDSLGFVGLFALQFTFYVALYFKNNKNKSDPRNFQL